MAICEILAWALLWGPVRFDFNSHRVLVLGGIVGKVRDIDGRPIAGAIVGNMDWTSEGPGGNTTVAGRSITSADGVYRFSAYRAVGSQLLLNRVRVEAKGYVTIEERFPAGSIRPGIAPGRFSELNFVLARGEILAGIVDVPLSRAEKLRGLRPRDQRFIIIVRGPSFKDIYMTKEGGMFEIWVPKGSYSIELLEFAGLPGPSARLDHVPAGTRGIRLRPLEPALPPEVIARAFETIWAELDRNYSYFTLKKVNWRMVRERHAAEVLGCRTRREFTDAIGAMLGELKDGHVWIETPNGPAATYVSPAVAPNYNRAAVLVSLKDVHYCGAFAAVGRTKSDGFGAFVMLKQSTADDQSASQAVDVIRSMRSTPGFLIDLRDANGGSEPSAKRIASEFCATETVYARSKYRAGAGHDEFGPTYARQIAPGQRPYHGPVVCLIGRRCVSSGEAFAQMMKCLPNVTLIGQRTRGSSGNPKPFKVPALDMTVWYSRWLDMMPDGSPIEDIGVQPGVVIDLPAASYADADPTWNKAVEMLRGQISHNGASAGPRTR